jgi:hypothetical protein
VQLEGAASFFLTDNNNSSHWDIPFKTPTQVIQVIEQIEEKNINLIQNTNQAEAQYDLVFKEHQALEKRLLNILKINQEKMHK